jgi:hypothetical protein
VAESDRLRPGELVAAGAAEEDRQLRRAERAGRPLEEVECGRKRGGRLDARSYGHRQAAEGRFGTSTLLKIST